MGNGQHMKCKIKCPKHYAAYMKLALLLPCFAFLFACCIMPASGYGFDMDVNFCIFILYFIYTADLPFLSFI